MPNQVLFAFTKVVYHNQYLVGWRTYANGEAKIDLTDDIAKAMNVDTYAAVYFIGALMHRPLRPDQSTPNRYVVLKEWHAVPDFDVRADPPVKRKSKPDESLAAEGDQNVVHP